MEGLLSTGISKSSFTEDHRLYEIINYNGICRTAPATQGLVFIGRNSEHFVVILLRIILFTKGSKNLFLLHSKSTLDNHMYEKLSDFDF